ncbi:DegQ family serine endoprotease [Chitiniphilus eburneus]|uniref:Probable periplasmic serine endoprotease DegP-like n=1 Tax=Chitiniphilus eburneus TaxID=2571148 RepID=A0A4V5MS50_9NEIS|nr:DegQ family serine endoprotease [Chitiniphilus eburneus]TJZ78878.1 DegQ family serine endoprotease [Chitiniphilus eburneus]
MVQSTIRSGQAFTRKLLALTLAATLGGAVAVMGDRFLPRADASVEPAPAPVATAPAPANVAPLPTGRAGLPQFGDIVTRYGPAVVNISVTGMTKTTANNSGVPGLDDDDPLSQFFRRFGGPRLQRPMPVRGLGSGFIVSADGVILTNAHVVADADEVTVKLTDKREFKAKVLGLDKVSDIAVLRIQATNLPTVKIGNPDTTRVGDWVLAIGSPFGFENSVTAGIVSAKSRSLPDDGYVPFIQTDAAVNPGNSGGPLFNMDGEVIGINSQIYSRSGGFQGLSFAIPIDVARNVQTQIVSKGKVTRGQLGVAIQDVNQSLAQSFGLSSPHGALVSGVDEKGAGAKAGLKPGDIILKYNDREVAGSADLPPMVANTAPGSGATLRIWRNGKEQELKVRVGEMQDTQVATAEPTPRGKLGLALRPLSPQERDRSGIASGLVVQDVTGPAAKAGIEPGDVLLAVNGAAIKDMSQLKQLVEKAGDHVALLVQRGDAQIFIPLDLG